jgi:hypothetical protein
MIHTIGLAQHTIWFFLLFHRWKWLSRAADDWLSPERSTSLVKLWGLLSGAADDRCNLSRALQREEKKLSNVNSKRG